MDTMDNKDLTGSTGGSQSVDRALGLLSLLANLGGAASMSDLIAETGLTRPTIRRLMLALIRAGLVEQDDQSRSYRLGVEAYVIGLVARRNVPLLDLAMDSLYALCDETGESSFLCQRNGVRWDCLFRQDGQFPIRTYALQSGDCHPLGVGAAGLAMLSALPQQDCIKVRQEIRAELDRAYPSYGDAVLDERLAEARAAGVALNPGLNMPNSWGMAVPLLAPGGVVMGALSLAAIDSRMGPDRQPEIARLLKREAEKIEHRLRTRQTQTA